MCLTVSPNRLCRVSHCLLFSVIREWCHSCGTLEEKEGIENEKKENKARSSMIHHIEKIGATIIEPWGTPQGLLECKNLISTSLADKEGTE